MRGLSPFGARDARAPRAQAAESDFEECVATQGALGPATHRVDLETEFEAELYLTRSGSAYALIVDEAGQRARHPSKSS